jgi:putative membrane protein
MMHFHGGTGLVTVLVLFVLMVLLGGVAAVLVLTVTRAGHSAQTPPSAPTGTDTSASRAHAILDERFARGEIDEGEHRARRAVLDERRP